MDNREIYLAFTPFMNWADELLQATAREVVGDAVDEIDRAVRLFYYVRDHIRYNPYVDITDAEVYRASRLLRVKEGFCVPKAILLAAMARWAGIPSRLRFANIINHLLPENLKNLLQGNLIYGHGFCELYLDKRWVMATPAFDRALCEEHNYRLVEFNGREDAVLPDADIEGRKHVEYVEYSGSYDDLPLEWLVGLYKKHYPL